MALKIVQMSIPVDAIGIDQSTKRIEDSELHVGMDPMNQCYASVGQIEQHRVLVGHSGGPDHTNRVLVEAEPLPVVDQSVHANPPWLFGCRVGKIGICHHQLGGTVRLHPLESRVLIAPDSMMTRRRKDALELKRAPVVRHEDEEIGDVVDKTRPAELRVGAIALPNSPREDVVAAVMVKQTGVEDRPVAGHGTGCNERHITHAAYDRFDISAMFVAASAILCHSLYSSVGEDAK